MITLLLTGVFATHSWTYGNQLTRVCEYRAPKEVSWTYYNYPPRLYLPWDFACPRQYQFPKKS